MNTLTRAIAIALLALVAGIANAEQFEQYGPWRVHYIAFNASLLSATIAERYGIVRGRNKGLVNITAVGTAGRGERAGVTGRYRNLLGQSYALDFREIDDGDAVYYLAAFDFDNAETLRFEVLLDLPGHGTETLRFQQPLYDADWRGYAPSRNSQAPPARELTSSFALNRGQED